MPDALLPPSQFGPPADSRAIGDAPATRRAIYDNVLGAFSELPPIANQRHTLKLTGVNYQDPENYSYKERKQAKLAGETLGRRIRGTWELSDNATGQVLDSRHQVIARVPFLSDDGTILHNGSEYTVNNQQRLRPGAYTREKANGELETHIATLPGKGVSHRYFLNPEKGTFHIRMLQSEMPLIPLLRAMGATDRELRDAWGDDLLAANTMKDDPSALKKLWAKLRRHDDPEDDNEPGRQRLIERWQTQEVDPDVMKRTLGHPHTNLNKDAILAITKKLVGVSKKEQEPDERDDLAYQRFFGPEDLLAERVRKDHSRLQKQLLFKAGLKGNLSAMPSGALTPQLEQLLLGSGLALNLEEINMAEVLDKQSRVTRMGEGAIGSTDAIPPESRGVLGSHLGYIDSLRTPESMRAGIDLQLARSTRKGKDGKLYAPFRDISTGQEVWKTPEDIADEPVAFPGEMASDLPSARAMKGGKLDFVPKDQIRLEVPHYENSFSPLANLVPLKSAMQGQRVSMASRMLTQALPLQGGEAPLVRSAVPGSGGTRSFEEEYGSHLGAVRAQQAGRVAAVRDDGIDVRYADGTTGTIDLRVNDPMNRKSFINQTSLVGVGDVFALGSLLAMSNHTDKEGAMALGLNARTAYMSYKGINTDDAIVISESMSRRLRSEHAYQHGLEIDPKHKLGKKAFMGLYPGKYSKEAIARLDDKGIIKPGSEVSFGDPLIVAVREKEDTQNKIHRRKQPGWQDASVTWEHEDPGVVTDVVEGRHGPVVVVKSYSETKVADKLSGRFGSKGVIGAIISDNLMPRNPDGEPYEVLMDPTSTVSRGNPAQLHELALGKIAAKTGKPYKLDDFADVKDWGEFARQELKKHGMTAEEDVIDPEFDRKIPNVKTGNSWIMKLHHQAEGKAQGRGGGSYSSENEPAKGGPAGCLLGDTLVETPDGEVTIADIVRDCMRPYKVASSKPYEACDYYDVIDRFHFKTPPDQVMELEFENGQRLTLTKNHEVVLASGQKCLARDLKLGDELMEKCNGSAKICEPESEPDAGTVETGG